MLVPYLPLMREDASQRTYPLRELFNGLRLMARTGLQWRSMPHDLPPGPAVYQQTRHWLTASVFDAIIAELRELIRIGEGRSPEPSVVVKLLTAQRGFNLLPRRWVVERDFGWMSRFRRLARDHERLAEVLKGFHLLASCMLMWTQVLPMLGGCNVHNSLQWAHRHSVIAGSRGADR